MSTLGYIIGCFNILSTKLMKEDGKRITGEIIGYGHMPGDTLPGNSCCLVEEERVIEGGMDIRKELRELADTLGLTKNGRTALFLGPNMEIEEKL